eukprot:PhM_4_TR3141/c0_g1_i1/m.37880/K05681/ABCG2, CD338; ATP-binding cassette, subfamily G (WHITE), member 2
MGVEVVFCDVSLRENVPIRGLIRSNAVTGIVSVDFDTSTQLLHSLAGAPRSSGVVFIDGRPANSREIRPHVAFCSGNPDEEKATLSMLTDLTVYEALQLRCQLNRTHISRNKKGASAAPGGAGGNNNATEQTLITRILNVMSLTGVKDTYVRDLGTVSRRRLVIALEMIVPPRLLLLQDPAEGLRGDDAAKLTRVLRKMAHGVALEDEQPASSSTDQDQQHDQGKEDTAPSRPPGNHDDDDARVIDEAVTGLLSGRGGGPTVVLSISNLTWGVLHALDDVILVDRGEIAFAGPRDEVVPFFTDMGFDLAGTSACDMIMDTLKAEAAMGGQRSAIAHHYRTTELRRRMEEAIAQHQEDSSSPMDEMDDENNNNDSFAQSSRKRATSLTSRASMARFYSMGGIASEYGFAWMRVMWVLFWCFSLRSLRSRWKTYMAWLVLGTGIAALLGHFFELYNEKTGMNPDDVSTAANAQNVVGVMFLTLTAFYHLNHLAQGAVSGGILSIAGSRHPRRRLIAACHYVVANVNRFIGTSLTAASLGALVFFLIGVQDKSNFTDFIVTLAMSSYSHAALVQLVIVLTSIVTPPSLVPRTSTFFLNMLFLYFVCTCGFIVNLKTIPESVVWLTRPSLLRWAYEAVLINQLSNVSVNSSCDSGRTYTKNEFLGVLGIEEATTARMHDCLDVLVISSVSMVFLAFFIVLLIEPRKRV